MNTMKHMMTKLALLLLVAAAGSSAKAQQQLYLAPLRAHTFSGTAGVGSGTITYQWYKNGAAINGATSQSYSMSATDATGINVEIKRGTKSSGCPNDVVFSNIFYVTFCGLYTTSGVCWASANAASNKTFGSLPDEYTPHFLWNIATAWTPMGSIPTWTTSTATSWAAGNNPCPTGWRLPTQAELTALYNAGSTWANANAKGNAVAGRFFGSCTNSTLPNNMTANCTFLPAVGSRYSRSLADFPPSVGQLGSAGFYWSSTNSSSTEAYHLYFDSSNRSVSAIEKGYGMSVRCVMN